MKKYLITYVILFSIKCTYAQNWNILATPVNRNLHSVYFPSADTGYIVGDYGTILKTTQGGSTWIKQNSGITTRLNAVYFSNPDIGYAVGDSGTILKTVNGGNIWSKQITGIQSNLNSIYFSSMDSGYAVGDSGTFLKSNDGGTSWAYLWPYYLNFFNGNIKSVFFINDFNGYACSENFFIYIFYKSIEKGIIQSRLTYNEKLYHSVYFTNKDTGYCVGDSGTIVITYDGTVQHSMTKWFKQKTGTINTLFSVFFADKNTGYAVGDNGTILRILNGDTNWTALNSGTTLRLYSVYFTNVNTGYAVGNNGIILKTINGTGINNNYISAFPQLFAYPNPITDKLFIEVPKPSKESVLTIYNTSGQELLNQNIYDEKTELDISNLFRGVYFLKFTDSKSSEVIKIIKE